MNENTFSWKGLACLAVLLPALLFGQVDTGVLSGTIYDNSGAVIPGANVALLNVGTNYSLELTSNQSGLYVSPPLPAGVYRITVTMEGFLPAAREVQLSLAERLAVDLTLELGSVTEQVTVEALGVTLQTEDATLSTLRSEAEVKDLPVNDRNFAELMRYTPGAVPGQAHKQNRALSQARGNTSNSVNGSTFADNNFLVDGIQNNGNHQGWGVMLFPEVEALEQYRVETSTPDARYGRSGATVNIGYKSGTNDFHGTLFHFFRNDRLDARNFFASKGKPALRRNLYGGILSGPLLGKDSSTFFLASFEGRRTRLGKTFLSNTPTQLMRGGDFSELLAASKPTTIFDPLTTRRNDTGNLVRDPFPGNRIPASMFNLAGENVINHFPVPNQGGLASNFLVSPSDTQDSDQVTFKLDHSLSGGSRGFIRYTQGDFDNIEGRELGNIATPDLLVDIPVQQIVPSYTHVFSPRVINQTRLGLTYQPLQNFELDGGQNTAQEFGIPGVNTDEFTTGLSQITAPGLTSIGNKGCRPATLRFLNYQISNNTDLIRGNHNISFGFDVVRRHANVRQTCNPKARFIFGTIFTNNPASPRGTGSGPADLLLGAPQRVIISAMSGNVGLRRSDWGFHFQDDWKVTPELTINLGLRYEVAQDFPHSEVADRLSQFDISTGTPFPFVGTEFEGGPGVEADMNNLAPRVGLAYRASDSTVLRAGYGIYYSLVPVPVVRSLTAQAPNVVSTTVANNQADFAGARSLTDGPLRARAFDAPGQNRIGIVPNFRIPYVQQWNVALQQRLPGEQTITIAYVGTKATSINQSVNYNQAVPGEGPVSARRRWPQHARVSIFQSAANSTYHALQTTIKKRFSSGLAYRLAYTYSHYIDDGSVAGGGSAVTGSIPITNLALNKGNANQDLRHHVRATFQYELPFGRGKAALANVGSIANAIFGGWQVNGAASMYTGLPFSVTARSTTLNIGEGSRADRLGEGSLSAGQRTIRQWFDIDAFANPGFRLWGNGGRNILFGPRTTQFDFSLFKNFEVGDGKRLQFRTEFFNALNTPQFNNPNSRIGSAATGRINRAGSEATLQRTQRQIQFALKFMF